VATPDPVLVVSPVLHLRSADHVVLQALLARHLPGVAVRAFGSRVAGWPGSRGLKPHSDLDLAVPGRPADLALAALRADLEDSDLPWRVDVCLLAELTAPLQRLIASHGTTLADGLNEPNEPNEPNRTT
jgi:predicted nucleotidyltransferase